MINTNINKKEKIKWSKKIMIILLSAISLATLLWCNFNRKSDNVTKLNNLNKTLIINTINNQNKILEKYNWNYKGNTVINKFSKAKNILYKIYNKNLWEEYRKTIYCWCDFVWKKVNKKSCWLITKGYKKRSNRIEREHVVPAENFWRAFKSWRDGNSKCYSISRKTHKKHYYKWRKCAEKVSPLFNLMEADIYNLFPADGALNAYRSNYQIAEIPWEKRKFWQCDFEIENRKVEPPQDKKGDIARVYMYMQLVYGKNKGLKIISEKNKKLIEVWNKIDPISKEECEVYYIKKKYEKNINPILEVPCKNIIWKK